MTSSEGINFSLARHETIKRKYERDAAWQEGCGSWNLGLSWGGKRGFAFKAVALGPPL